MTLFKQIALLVSLVFLLIVITIMAASIRQYGSIVNGQLQTTAQDMVTTLGITISNSSFGNDKPAYETLFNAVFDSGYYSSIEIIATDGELIHKKEREHEVEGVPQWFISLVPIAPAAAVTQVMRGWSPLGTLRLTLHPGYVYYGLYKNLETALIWFVVLFSIGMLVLWITLHQLLKPLGRVRQQADAIHNNQFVKQSSLPRTIELRAVVNTMNRMVDKVHAVFDDQQDTLGRYQKLLYEDLLTGLGNRRYFMSHLEAAHSDEAAIHCHLAVVRIVNLDLVREQYGYEKSDNAVIVLANILKGISERIEDYYCARFAPDEFALLVPSGEQSVSEYIQNIFDQYRSDPGVADMDDEISLIAGISNIKIGNEVGETLADTDFALSQAEAEGPYSFRETSSTGLVLPQGKIQWRNWLEECISNNRFFLVKQKVMTTAGEAIHQEVFVRLKNEDNQTVPAGLFLPMASALKMGEAIDHVVFSLVKDLSNNNNEIPLALNLTASVFSHADALFEFNQLLKFFQQSEMRLCVEASHAVLDQFPAMCAQVAESVRNAGQVFGIDNLNLGRSLQELKSVRPNYLKLNAQTLYDMTHDEIPVGYQALQSMVRTMDIKLIAVAVDSQEIYDHLQQLGIEAMQGNLLHEAEEFV
jgi:EAL domain-containing protein (putative c-di-GMP-specific phosphodiesterase class I)/GGDEF domain-containing protein